MTNKYDSSKLRWKELAYEMKETLFEINKNIFEITGKNTKRTSLSVLSIGEQLLPIIPNLIVDYAGYKLYIQI